MLDVFVVIVLLLLNDCCFFFTINVLRYLTNFLYLSFVCFLLLFLLLFILLLSLDLFRGTDVFRFSQQEVAYIVDEPAQATTATSNTGDPLSPDNQASLSHVTKISPATVQWLIDNYETAEGVSLPRSSLFNHYIRHCAENKLDAVNAASFGKLIRSVFIGLRTRRLGTR